MKLPLSLAAGLCLLAKPVWAQNAPASFADLVEQLQPAVVNISTTHMPSDNEDVDDGLGIISPNPQIQNYFAPHNPQQVSLGSGFVVDETGYIVTNHHVIDKAQEINVTLADERQLAAEIVGSDVKTDLALIRVKTAEKLPTVKLGNSDKIRAGDWIIAIGNPFGLGGSVTAGIISAKSRDIEAGAYDNFIQTDASINQGSSGGPMFNMNGEVIGINSAIYSTSGGSMGIGFATPINLAKFVIEQLKSKGKVDRGWLGIKIQDADNGIVVTSVAEDSPAKLADIEAGDVIISLNEQKITDPKQFSRQIAETSEGSKITLKTLRNQQPQIKNLVVKKMPDLPLVKPTTPPQTNDDNNLLGMEMAELTPELIERYQLEKDSNGVVVMAVKSGSDAEIKGIKPGDLIAAIDKKKVWDINDVRAAVDDAKQENNRQVLLMINNHNVPQYAVVKP